MKPYYDDGQASIYHGDARELLAALKADVIVTDPPYGLAFMGKEWDKPYCTKFHRGWAEKAFQALPPGGWLLAFGGTRTWHRLACGIEDAGFEIRDTLMWLYGSGFPKAKTCLKPGWEPILLARKPGSNVLQIDACRIAHGPEVDLAQRQRQRQQHRHDGDEAWRLRPGHEQPMYSPSGRWPANVVLDEVVADLLDQQSGERPGFSTQLDLKASDTFGGTAYGTGKMLQPGVRIGHNDTGGASRFFYTAKAGRTERVKVDGEQHPTVKPLALMRWLVRLVCPPGGTILDPFCGSGSTLVAARMEGFRAVGIEADVRWCEGSAMRLREHEQGQGVLDLSG